MYKYKKTISCPLEYGLQVFGGRWKAKIIYALSENGVLRYSEIRKEVKDISDTLLTSNLKELIQDEIVERKQYSEIPPRVEYSLSKKGQSVVPILKSIMDWSKEYCNEKEC